MMYGLERRRITVYKYLKGNIQRGREIIYSNGEEFDREQKLASRSRGELGRTEETEHMVRVIKQRNVILALVCVARS